MGVLPGVPKATLLESNTSLQAVAQAYLLLSGMPRLLFLHLGLHSVSMQALPDCSIAEAEQQTGDAEDEEEEQQQAPSPTKGGGGLFGRTQAVKAQTPQVRVSPLPPPSPALEAWAQPLPAGR